MPRAKSSLRIGPVSFSSVFTAVPDRIERRKPLASLHQQEMDFFLFCFLEAEALCLFRRLLSSPRKTDRLPSRFMPPPPCRGEPGRTRGFVPAAPPLPDSASSLCSWMMEKGSFSCYVFNDIVLLLRGRWEILGSEARLLIRGRSRLGPVYLPRGWDV